LGTGLVESPDEDDCTRRDGIQIPDEGISPECMWCHASRALVCKAMAAPFFARSTKMGRDERPGDDGRCKAKGWASTATPVTVTSPTYAAHPCGHA